MRRVYKNLCPATISASIMAANIWKNSLKNVESDNNNILYETLLNFSYSETVLTFRISLILPSVTHYWALRLYSTTDFVCIPVFCPKLRLHLVLFQFPCLLHNLTVRIPLLFSNISSPMLLSFLRLLL